MTDRQFRVEPDGETTLAACPDCGNASRSVWGYVSDSGGARAAYFIRWTEGHLERGAQFVVSLGAWGKDADPRERVCFALECRMGVDRPQFMVVDAGQISWAQREILGVRLSRENALANPSCKELFAILDQIVDDDDRFRSFLLRGGRNQEHS